MYGVRFQRIWKAGKLRIFIYVFIIVFGYNLAIFLYRYLDNNGTGTPKRTLIQTIQYESTADECSPVSISDSVDFCPKTFQMRQPLFPWPPKPICDIECAVSGLTTALPKVPWFAEKYRKYFNFSIQNVGEKWFNLADFLRPTAYRLLFHNLYPPKEQKIILDIGTGFGYFPFFASHFNHCVIAVDRCVKTNHESQLFRNVTNILGVDVRQHHIFPLKPFSINLFSGIKFDIVTAYLGWFHCQPRLWLIPEWDYFITDIARHHTASNARVYLHMNGCPDKTPNTEASWNKTVRFLKSKRVEFIDKNLWPPRMLIKDLRAFRSYK